MSLELHAALGFLQAIHHSARVAKVNSKCCRLLSRAVGKIRPLLEELDMAAADGEAQPKLGKISTVFDEVEHVADFMNYQLWLVLSISSLSTALENVHMMVVRFSAMGELQAVLESETMVGKFTQACEGVASTLQSLLAENMKDDINSISKQLLNINVGSSLAHRQLAKDVRTTAVQILEEKCSSSDGHMKIRNMLYVICRYARDDMVHEMKGLERERSRAKAEGDEHELGIITEVIRALERRTPAAAAAAAANSVPPQPPVEYLCPISHMIMRDPVILVETGQTYDRPSIEEWFSRGNNMCPITKRVVQQFQLTQNFALKSLATTWIEVHGCEEQGIEFVDNGGGPAGCRGQATTAGLDNVYQKNQLKQLGGLRGTFDLGIIPVMQVQPFVQPAIPGMTFGKSGEDGIGLSKKPIECEKEIVKIDSEDCKKVKEGVEKTYSFSPAPPSNSALEALRKALGTRSNSLDVPRPKVPKEDTNDQDSSAPELFGDNAAEGKTSQKTPPLPPRRCSVDSSYAYSRVSPFPQTDDARSKNGRTSGEFSRIAPLSRQGGVQFLQDAISSCRRSLDRHRPPVPSSESARRKSAEQASCKSVGSGHRYGSEQSGSPRCTNTMAHEITDYGCHQLFPGIQQNMSFNLLSASSYSCSMSSQSDSCDEEENYHGIAESQNKDQDTAMIWHSGPDFDALSFASLSTINPGGFKVAPSLGTSFGKKSTNSRKQALPRSGAVNLLFDDCRSECPEMDSTEVSIPVLIEMIKSNDINVATASANELAMRVFKDTGLEVDVEKSGLVEKLMEMLEFEDSEARLAAARTLGTLSEKCSVAREHIVESGASRSLADLTKAGSVRCMDVADWALNRLSMEVGSGEHRSSASVEVSTPMLVQMLLSGDKDVQASAALDLKDRLLKSFNGFEGLTQPDAIWKLVDLLEYERPDIQLAAATVLSLLVFRSQDVHNQVATRAGTVIRLVRLVKDANDSCAAAAAQVLRTLAHGNSDVCEEILARGIVPALDELLLCASDEDGAREVSAWLLGILGSHSDESQEAIQSGQSISNLEHLLEVGQPHEVIAASWALQNILSATGEFNECEVSIPIVLESLKSGCESIKIASVGELFHLANEGFWFQMEILKSGGLRFLLEFLETNPCSDGIYGALVTIDKLVKDVPSCPLELCRDGGIPVLVNFLKTDDKIERQLAMDILLVLADRCPLHQPEVVTKGAVPLLVNLLVNEDPSACSAAYEVLHKLADSAMSVVSSSMAAVSTPALLEILSHDGGDICGKEAAAKLIETISSSLEGQQELLKHKAMNLLMQVMETGESYILKKAAGNAVAVLVKKNTKAHGNLAGAGVFSNLVGLLQNSRIPRASGLKSAVNRDASVETSSSAAIALQQFSAPKAFGNPLSSRLYSHAPLPAVPESVAEESEAGDAHSAYGPSCNPSSVVGSETTSCTCPESGATPIEVESCTSENGEDVKVLVNILKTGMGSGKEDAATRLRSLAQIDKASRLELVQSGAVPLLVEMLQTKSFK